jgi:phosphoribosylaminoimidazolecarboxamide formyltransferase/IMP cyclohydrolase
MAGEGMTRDGARDGMTMREGSSSRSDEPPEARIAVCVSGQGSNLRALHRAERRGALGAHIVLVLADRECPGLAWARKAGIDTALVSPARYPDREAWDGAVTDRLRGSGADLVALAGFMRLVGTSTLAAFPGRILNIHPALLPSFRGASGVSDALAAGVKVTGVTVHVVTAELDGGPIVLQEAVPILPGDDEERLLERIHEVEHRLFPRAVRLAAGGALTVADGVVSIDPARAAELPRPRRGLLSVSDKTGLVELAAGLTDLGFELVSTGGTARALRDAGLAVTDVAAVTGFPEMLDGRVKTLHPRIEGAILADLRLQAHREQLALHGIDPFEIVVVNLYPFAAAAARPGLSLDQLVEEIDIGGPTLVRAAAKNHASVAIVTDPSQYAGVLAELRERGSISDEARRWLAAAAFRHTARYDVHISSVLPARMGLQPPAGAEGAESAESAEGADAHLPSSVDLRLERVQLLRYGENPHQAAALYRVPGTASDAGPFADGADLRQGKPLSYNNLLDAAVAAGVARDLRGPGCVIVKHGNPCGVAEAADMPAAWDLALAGDPISAFGGVTAVTRPIDEELARCLTSIFLEVVVAPGLEAGAELILAGKPNLRVLVDSWLGRPAAPPLIEYRSAGGGMLATEADTRPDDPAAWRLVTSRPPTDPERHDLELAWRIARHVKSNAIVLVKDGALVGVGAGQMSRVDSARLAVAKAGPERARAAVCASDAFYPFPDGVLACAEAGVTAFVQPGGSLRDEEVIATAEAAGCSMLVTGVRHFRH